MRRADATAWSGDANITRWLIDSEGAARGAYPGAVIGVRKMVVARSRTLFARRQPSLKQAHDHCDHDDHPSIPSLPASPAPRTLAAARIDPSQVVERGRRPSRVAEARGSRSGRALWVPKSGGAGPQIWGPAELGPSERIPRRPARKARSPDRMLRHRHHAALPHSRGIQKRAHSGPALAATSKAGGKHVARTSAGRTLPQPAGQPRRKWQQASTCAWRCSSCVPLLSSPLAHTHVCPLARVCRRPLMSSTSPS